MDLTWLQDLLKTGGEVYSTVKTADALKHQQTTADGMLYTNGAFGTPAGGAANNNGMILLLAGAVLLVVFLKD